MKYTFIYFILFFISCNSTKHSTTLKKDLHLGQIFNQDEIQGFINILEFFDNEICPPQSKNKIQECYKAFFQRMSNNLSENLVEINIPFEKQLVLHQQLDKTIQNEIWFSTKMFYYRKRYIQNNTQELIYPDTLNNILILSSQGKYAEFLNSYSKENSKVRFYYDQLILDHGISPTVFADIIENYRSYDISDDKIRLIVAIHYLTLNYQYYYKKNSEDKLDQMLKKTTH